MHLVVDMQGIQTNGPYRSTRRVATSLVKAIIRRRGDCRITLALNGLFAQTIKPIVEEFAGLLPAHSIRVWESVGPAREDDSDNQFRREVSERLREAFLESLQPDVILIAGLFEGYRE